MAGSDREWKSRDASPLTGGFCLFVKVKAQQVCVKAAVSLAACLGATGA